MSLTKIIKIGIALIALAALTFGGIYAYKTYYSEPSLAPVPVTEELYEVIKGDDLPELNHEKLKEVDRFIVIWPEFETTMTVAVKMKDAKTIKLYRPMNENVYQDYSKRVLNEFKNKNPSFDFKVTSTFEGLGKRMDVSSDPVALMEKIKSKYVIDLIIVIVIEILKLTVFIGVMVIAMYYIQGSTMSNNIDVFFPKDLTDSLDDLVGIDDIKKEVLQLEEMLLKKELYADFGVESFNILLTGDAGVGKTKITKCLSKRLNVPLYYASAASLETGYVGGGAKSLKKLVKRASKHKRAIIFLDEAEGLLLTREQPTRSRHENETMTTLLSLLDGVGSKKSKNIIWMVASNFDDSKMAMDKAMLRRFQLKINFRLPNKSERKEMLQRFLDRRSKSVIGDDIALDHIATVSAGMSPATLETLISRACLIAIQNKSVITQEILLKAYERIAVGLTDRAATATMDSKRRVVAIHECGHFITQLHHALKAVDGDLTRLEDRLDILKISTESVSKFGALGFVLKTQEDTPFNNRREYEEKIIELYGGMANEELILGDEDVTAGAHNDIERVTSLLSMMFNEVGYYSKTKLNYKVLQSTGLDVGQQRLGELQHRSELLYSATQKILDRFRPLTDEMTRELMENYVMSKADYMPIILEYFEKRPDVLRRYLPIRYS
jgi:cell division protease FtsH